MDAKDFTCKVLSALMELDPDTEFAKLVTEFAQRSDAGDSAAFFADETILNRVKKAVNDVTRFEKLNRGKIESKAEDLASSL